jgi:Putative adhesin
MRVRRGLLFWGLLLIPLGGIPLLVRGGLLDPNRLLDAWRLWPLVLIGLGLLVLASRTRYAAVGTVVIALTIGSIGGAALASGNLWLGAIGGCGIGDAGGTTRQLDQSGTIGGSGQVRLQLNCGSIDLSAAPGSGWTLHATYRGDPPRIGQTADGLRIQSPDSGGDRRQDWTVRIPTDATKTLELTANAATSRVDLAGAKLDELHGEMNAGDLRMEATEATIGRLELTMNAGRIRLTLGSTATTGSLSVNAGNIDVCVPAGTGLQLQVEDQLTFVTNLASRGLTHTGNTWTRPASGGGLIDLSIEGNAASFNLNPDGGC